MTLPAHTLDWGVVRYLPGSGPVPDEDVAAFDGWYASKAAATHVYADWCHAYPQFIVALVQQKAARWLEGH
jgi:hypothetical protein